VAGVTSFVIDPKGTVRKVYTKVNSQGHDRVLLDDIQQIRSA
jgi:peroxiredoxin